MGYHLREGMRRRRYLAALAAGAAGSLAGCANVGFGGSGSDALPEGEGTAGQRGTTAVGDVDLPVPKSELVRGAPKDAIPAIVDPVFGEDWSGIAYDVGSEFGVTYEATPGLAPSDRVVGVSRGGEARAYPLKVLNWHEVVNDSFPAASDAGGSEGDEPVLVTYCPLCGSAVTAVRRVNGEETTFGVSGFLFRNDLVMYDELTGSLWSQILATAINGPETGDTLELIPSTLTTWEAWRESHPDTVVLRPPPESSTVSGPDATRDYDRDPYAGYDESGRIGLGGDYDDDRLHPKATVVGVRHDGVARAYPLEAVKAAGVVNDAVGGLPVVVTVAPGDALVAYEREVDGETLTFAAADEAHLAAGGSRWERGSGLAADGPHEGAHLARANDVSPMFFFAWKDFSGGTEVYGAD